jgi:hypothetical protein
MKIIDTFIYNGETKMLNFRLHELYNYVDHFIIVEGTHSHKGDKKELEYPKTASQFEKFYNKIVYVIWDEVCSIPHDPYATAWANEYAHRRYIKNGLDKLQLNDEDVVLLSDVDEIPDCRILQLIKQEGFKGCCTLKQDFYYYNTNCKHSGQWPGTVVIDVQNFKQKNSDCQLLRDSRNSPTASYIEKGGWHFSYFGDVNFIIKKINQFSHQEFNNSYYTDPGKIQQAINEGKDLYGRNDQILNKAENETYLPRYVSLIQ